jgi:hypothetical protein
MILRAYILFEMETHCLNMALRDTWRKEEMEIVFENKQYQEKEIFDYSEKGLV